MRTKKYSEIIVGICVAGIASFIAPGIWHMFSRYRLFGAVIMLVFFGVPNALVHGFLVTNMNAIFLGVVAKYLVLAACVGSALVVSAMRLSVVVVDSEAVSLNKYLWMLIAAIIVGLVIPKGIKVYQVTTESMSPTLRSGDLVTVQVVELFSRVQGDINDVVVFQRDGVDFEEIKRVQRVEHVSAGSQGNKSGTDSSAGKRNYFVVGDNPAASYDSRQYGSISEDRLTGKVLSVFWAVDRTRVGSIKEMEYSGVAKWVF